MIVPASLTLIFVVLAVCACRAAGNDMKNLAAPTRRTPRPDDHRRYRYIKTSPGGAVFLVERSDSGNAVLFSTN
jgi:hypothetical protein